jgi:putative transposase
MTRHPQTKFDPQKHHRRSIRLQGYHYSQAGAYYVTIVAQGRTSLFGEIVNEEMILSPAGLMVQTTWQSMPERFPRIDLGAFTVMPNHFHAIVIINTSVDKDAPLANVGAGLVPAPVGSDIHLANVGTGPVSASNDTFLPPTTRAGTRPAPTVGQIIGAFKSITTHEYIQGVNCLGWPPFDKRLWQRNYYEHIIRTVDDAQHIEQYIASNPTTWKDDTENPHRTP